MTDHRLYQVDAFTDRLFAGNPAAVMVLDAFMPDDLLAAIARENNLSETAFAVRTGEGAYDLRWFTPGCEVPLCGHATLATAHVLWTDLGERSETLRFATLSGPLMVTRADDAYVMDFPASTLVPIDAPDGLADALGVVPEAVFASTYLMAVLPDEASVRALDPDMAKLAKVRTPLAGDKTDASCVCVTAPGEDADFVSRFFGPTVGIAEDPVTGSAHCMMTPYWAERLGKPTLAAYQASARGGHVGCVLDGDRVRLTGRAVTFSRGTVSLP